jgi:signal peptidase II
LTVGTAWRRALLLCVGVIALDQVAKAIVRGSLVPGERVDLVLGFHLTRITNKGLAFGTLGGGGPLVLVVTIAALTLVLAWFARDPTRPWLWLGAGLLAGGAVGNLIDRVRLDAVTDFLDPPLWPAFNLADIAITVGALVLILVSLEGGEADDGAAHRPP